MGLGGPFPHVDSAEAAMVTASSLRSNIDDLLLKPVWQACHIHDVIQLLCLWATVLDQLLSLEEREKTTEQLLGREDIRSTVPGTKGGLLWANLDL